MQIMSKNQDSLRWINDFCSHILTNTLLLIQRVVKLQLVAKPDYGYKIYDFRAWFNPAWQPQINAARNLTYLNNAAFNNYSKEIKGGIFPDKPHSYHTEAGELERLHELLKGKL